MSLHDGKLGLLASNVTQRLNHTLRLNTIIMDQNKQYLKLIEKHRRIRIRKIDWESTKAARLYANLCSTRKVLDEQCLIEPGDEDNAPLLGPTGLGRYGGASIERLKPDILKKIYDNQPRLRRHRRAAKNLIQGQQDGRIVTLSTHEATKRVDSILNRPYRTIFEHVVNKESKQEEVNLDFKPSDGNTLILPPIDVCQTFKKIRKKLDERSLAPVTQRRKPIVLTPINDDKFKTMNQVKDENDAR